MKIQVQGVESQMDARSTITDVEAAFDDTKNLVATGPSRVDFAHPEFCTGCDPVTCIVEGNDFSGGNWRDVLISLTEAFLQSKPKAAELYHTSLFSNGERVFLMKDKPKLSARQLSNGYWINVNLSIKDLVITIGRLCQFCGVDHDDVNITYVSKQTAGGSKHVLLAIGLSEQQTKSSIRISFGRYNKSEDVNQIVAAICAAYGKILACQ